MNIKVKSQLKYINIKLSSKNIKIKLFITRNIPKRPKHPKTPRNINRYVSVVSLVPGGAPKRNISGVSTETV